MKHTMLIALAALLVVACNRHEQPKPTPHHRGIYHWKTTYNPTDWEKQWMTDHHIDRLYVKLFEVDAGSKHGYDEWHIVPVATTRFLQPLPTSVRVVPVVYITVDAVKALSGSKMNYYYAEQLVDRIYAMLAEHYGGTVNEVQVDCDWTTSTRDDFFAFCHNLQRLLKNRDAVLGGTVRLHQLIVRDIPFEHKLLMCYNTGRLQSKQMRNSILDCADVRRYLDYVNPSVLQQYDVAYPAYGWGVQFDSKGQFQRLTKPTPAKHRRIEWGEPDQVARAKQMLPTPSHSTVVLYHLDEENLKHYTYEEIENMYGPRVAD